MAVDMMVCAGVPPPEASAPAGNVSATTAPPEGDATFANAIAAALEASDAGVVATPAVTPAGVLQGLESLVALRQVPADDVSGPVPPPDQLDRDAEAEESAAMFAALMLGLPIQAQPQQQPIGMISDVPSLVASVVAGVGAEQPAAVSDAAGPAAPPQTDGTFVPDALLAAAAERSGPVADLSTTPTTAAIRPALSPAMPVAPASAGESVVDSVEGASSMAGASQPIDVIAEVARLALIGSQPGSGADVPEESRIRRSEPTDSSVQAPGIDAPSAGGALAMAPAVLDRGIAAPVPVVTVAASDGAQLASGIADTVQAATLHGDRELRIALNPPDLGQLDVRITTHEGGTVTVAIHASSPEAHDLLQQQLPALRAGLEQRDVRVEQLHVEQQAPSAGLGWADNGGRQARDGRNWRDAQQQPEWSPVAAMRRVSASAIRTLSGRSDAASSGIDVRA